MPVTEDEAANALPPDGWLRRYCVHGFKQTTAPLCYHIGVGLSLLAATSPTAFGMHYAASALRSNQFVLLLGRSGEENKSSALNVGKEILDTAAAPLVGNFPGSAEGLIESLAQQATQWVPMSEFGRFLSSAQGGYFEPIKSLLAEAWDCLDEDTQILTTEGWVPITKVTTGMTAITLDPETDTIVHSRIVDAQGRPVRDDERMVELKNQYLDIRTTEGHRFYVKYRDPSNSGPSKTYQVKKGAEMVERKSAYYLPRAGTPTRSFEGVALTDDELRFVSWAITDGGMWDKQLTISQARGPKADRIRELLARLNFSVLEYVTILADDPAKDKKSNFRRNKDLLVFRLQNSNGHNAWQDYAPYLSDDLAPVLENMTDAQFRVFWHELLLGDGEQVGDDGTMKGLLWSVRAPLIDRLQAMAVERGYTTQYGTRDLPSGKTAYRLSITEDRRFICMAPGDARSVKFKFADPKPGEWVYCATTEHGTLVTRRNGKVVILGNCGGLQRALARQRVIRVDNPRLSLAAACSIPYLEKHTLAEDWTGGFMGRWLVMYGMRERIDPDPVGDRTDFDWLVDEIRRRASTPSAGWCVGLDPMAKRYWFDWYEDISNRILPGNIVGIRSRAPTMARKIALALAWDFGPAAWGQPWEMELDVLDYAIRITELHVKSLIDLSSVIAEHDEARFRRTVLQAISSKGGMATLGEILEITKTKKRPVTDMLDALLESEVIAKVNTTKGFAFALARFG